MHKIITVVMGARRGRQREMRRELAAVREAKIYLYPLRLGLRIKLTQTDEQEKSTQIFTLTWESS